MSPEEDDVRDDDAVATRLRHALDEVARATPATDRRAEVLAALDDRRTPWRPARVLAPAAALIVMLLAAVLVVDQGGGGGDDERAGGGPAADAALAGPYDDPDLDTGWYLPGDGWTIVDVRTDYLDVGEAGACPCRAWAAGRPGEPGAVLDVSETAIPTADGFPPVETTEEVDVGGRPGRRSEAEGRAAVWVDTGGRRIAVTARGVPDDALVAVVDAWADAVEAGRPVDGAALPLPDGYARTPVQAKEGTFEHVVAVTALQASTGHHVEYQLVPTGYQRYLLLDGTTIADGGGSIVFVGEDGEAHAGDPGSVAGAIGGPVDVTAGIGFFGGEGTDLDAGGVADFLASLREVDAGTWRAALPADGDVDEDLRTAPTLFAPPLVG